MCKYITVIIAEHHDSLIRHELLSSDLRRPNSSSVNHHFVGIKTLKVNHPTCRACTHHFTQCQVDIVWVTTATGTKNITASGYPLDVNLGEKPFTIDDFRLVFQEFRGRINDVLVGNLAIGIGSWYGNDASYFVPDKRRFGILRFGIIRGRNGPCPFTGSFDIKPTSTSCICEISITTSMCRLTSNRNSLALHHHGSIRVGTSSHSSVNCPLLHHPLSFSH